MWESVLGCEEGEGDVGRGMGGVGEGKGRCGGVKKCEERCERVYGVSVGKCVGVWGR